MIINKNSNKKNKELNLNVNLNLIVKRNTNLSLMNFKSKMGTFKLDCDMKLPKNFDFPINKKNFMIDPKEHIKTWSKYPKVFNFKNKFCKKNLFNKIQKVNDKLIKDTRRAYHDLYITHINNIEKKAGG